MANENYKGAGSNSNQQSAKQPQKVRINEGKTSGRPAPKKNNR